MVITSYIVDDLVYTMVATRNQDNKYPAIIFKLDINGILRDSFAVMRSFKSENYQYLLSVSKFYVLSDSSILIYAKTTYLQGEIGISDSSQIDASIFKINSTKDIEWSASVDFMNGIEEFANWLNYKNKVYVSVSTSKFYLWLISLDSRTGYLLNSKWIYLDRSTNEYRNFKLFYASDLYIYTFILSSKSYYSRIFMHNSNTLQLVKAFNIDGDTAPVGLKSPYNSAMINIISTNSQTFSSLLINENDLTYIEKTTLTPTWKLKKADRIELQMAKHLNDNFVLSISDQMLYDEISANGLDNIFLIVDFELNTNSCISFVKSNGIPYFIDEDLDLFLNNNETYYNMSAPPNTTMTWLKYKY